MNVCDNLPLYLYDELEAGDKKFFEEHLASCKECRESVRIFTAVQKNKKIYDAPAGVIDAVFAKTTGKRPLFIFPKSFKLGLAFAACFLAAVLAVPSKKNAAYDNLAYSEVSIEEIISIASELDEFESDIMFYA
jgi:anti-sigma factor RsiW